jgi:predicted N-formylglutamate amidohydrolase
LDLVHRYHRPWREEVHQAVEDATREGLQVIHLSVHSFTPIMDGVDRRTDFALLYDPKRPAEKVLARRWLNTIRVAKPSWRLRSNFPYRGTADGHVTALRKLFPPEKYVGIELEFSQGLPLARQGAVLGQAMAKCLLEAIQ